MTYSVKKKGHILAAAMLFLICILSFAGISRASDQGIRVDYADLNLCDDNAAYTHYIIVGLSGDMDKITTCNLTLKGEGQQQSPIFYRKDGQSLVFYYRLPMGDYTLSTFSYIYDGKQYTADMTELSKKNELIDTELSVSLTDEERALIEEKAGALSSFLTPTVSRCAAVTSIGESRLQASVIGKKLGEGKYVVVIDPGHGGKCGASRTINGIKYYEDDFTLKIGNYIQAELANYSDITVLMTRTTDTNVSFESRCNLAGDNGAVLLVSLHLNATATTTTDTHGAEAIYQNSNYKPEVAAKSKEIAEIMVRGLESIGLTYRSIYYKNGASKFDDGSIADNFAINRMCKLVGVPGIILEHCFLNNMSDFENFLSTEDKVMALGVADAKSIVSYLGAGETASGELGAAKISKIVANGSTASVTFSYTGTMTPSGYALYRSLSKDGEYTKVATAVATAKNVKDTSMEYGVTYYYKVVPYSDRADGYKEGTASEVVSTYRCNAPSINTLERSGDGYMLMWDAVEGAGSYTIQRATVTGGTFSTLASSTSNSYVDTTAKAGTEYIYRVRAVKSYNSVSNYSSYSTSRFVGVSSLEVMPDGASALVSWSDLSYATGFKIYRKAVTASSYSLIATLSRAEGLSYLDTGIAGSTAYDYKIYAYVTIGSSSYMSLPKLATFIGTLETGKITGLKTGSSGSVTISYSEIPGVSGYEIYRKSKINGTASLVGTVAAGTLTYLDETASKGKAYFYAVRGYVKGSTATGYSELSDYLLSGPYLKAAVSYSDTENKINWTPQDNVSGYKIYAGF